MVLGYLEQAASPFEQEATGSRARPWPVARGLALESRKSLAGSSAVEPANVRRLACGGLGERADSASPAAGLLDVAHSGQEQCGQSDRGADEAGPD